MHVYKDNCSNFFSPCHSNANLSPFNQIANSNSTILSLSFPLFLTSEALFSLKSVKILGFYKFEKQKKGKCLNRDLNPQAKRPRPLGYTGFSSVWMFLNNKLKIYKSFYSDIFITLKRNLALLLLWHFMDTHSIRRS